MNLRIVGRLMQVRNVHFLTLRIEIKTIVMVAPVEIDRAISISHLTSALTIWVKLRFIFKFTLSLIFKFSFIFYRFIVLSFFFVWELKSISYVSARGNCAVLFNCRYSNIYYNNYIYDFNGTLA